MSRPKSRKVSEKLSDDSAKKVSNANRNMSTLAD
jgi:hypothetical protein